jgi:hypothetical protein
MGVDNESESSTVRVPGLYLLLTSTELNKENVGTCTRSTVLVCGE